MEIPKLMFSLAKKILPGDNHIEKHMEGNGTGGEKKEQSLEYLWK